MNDDLPAVLNVKEIAEYLRVHKSTIYRLLKRGCGLPVFKVASEWRTRREDLDRWRLEQRGESRHRK